ncbi:hypothetical protein N7517_006642 [Penicillium concentricum]|uniref:Uncharacterized protein n=1 Tax=Penicillium concentricum TaxID=293559 RepID=A0A9W9VCR8_9EURO|nr:uncharacterized protein N7517_006642 [Penicillium concentricum]KAJ5374636.1 hypothetical protein N7517_006642 [Penicillium concentricum]
MSALSSSVGLPCERLSHAYRGESSTLVGEDDATTKASELPSPVTLILYNLEDVLENEDDFEIWHHKVVRALESYVLQRPIDQRVPQSSKLTSKLLGSGRGCRFESPNTLSPICRTTFVHQVKSRGVRFERAEESMGQAVKLFWDQSFFVPTCKQSYRRTPVLCRSLSCLSYDSLYIFSNPLLGAIDTPPSTHISCRFFTRPVHLIPNLTRGIVFAFQKIRRIGIPELVSIQIGENTFALWPTAIKCALDTRDPGLFECLTGKYARRDSQNTTALEGTRKFRHIFFGLLKTFLVPTHNTGFEKSHKPGPGPRPEDEG